MVTDVKKNLQNKSVNNHETATATQSHSVEGNHFSSACLHKSLFCFHLQMLQMKRNSFTTRPTAWNPHLERAWHEWPGPAQRMARTRENVTLPSGAHYTIVIRVASLLAGFTFFYYSHTMRTKATRRAPASNQADHSFSSSWRKRKERKRCQARLFFCCFVSHASFNSPPLMSYRPLKGFTGWVLRMYQCARSRAL